MYVGGKVIPFARSAFRFCLSDGRDRWRVHMCDYGDRTAVDARPAGCKLVPFVVSQNVK